MTTDNLVQNQAGLDAAQLNAPNQELTQDKVNYLVTKAKETAYEKARQEFEAKYQANATQTPTQAVKNLSEEQILDLIEKKADEKVTSKLQALKAEEANQNVARQIVEQYMEQMAEGRKEYTDFDEVAGIFNLQESPSMVALMTTVDKTTAKDVWYEFGKHPRKFGEIEALLKGGHKKAAEVELKKLTESINKNKEEQNKAKSVKVPNPLGQLKPSTAQVDGTELSQSAMKAAIRALRKY